MFSGGDLGEIVWCISWSISYQPAPLGWPRQASYVKNRCHVYSHIKNHVYVIGRAIACMNVSIPKDLYWTDEKCRTVDKGWTRCTCPLSQRCLKSMPPALPPTHGLSWAMHEGFVPTAALIPWLAVSSSATVQLLLLCGVWADWHECIKVLSFITLSLSVCVQVSFMSHSYIIQRLTQWRACALVWIDSTDPTPI